MSEYFSPSYEYLPPGVKLLRSMSRDSLQPEFVCDYCKCMSQGYHCVHCGAPRRPVYQMQTIFTGSIYSS